MPDFAVGSAIALAAAVWLMPAAAQAECKELRQFIKDETAGDEKYADTFSFRKNHRADSVLLLVKETIEKGHLPKRWLFLHRDDPASPNLCVAGRGEFFGQHDDTHEETASGATFGPPGSSSPNCATSTSSSEASDVLRDWANHDLGDSIILYTASRNTPGYQFVINKNQDWIIIQDQASNPTKSCFYDRGTDVMMRFNIRLIDY